jgi:hypothetical protein
MTGDARITIVPIGSRKGVFSSAHLERLNMPLGRGVDADLHRLLELRGAAKGWREPWVKDCDDGRANILCCSGHLATIRGTLTGRVIPSMFARAARCLGAPIDGAGSRCG